MGSIYLTIEKQAVAGDMSDFEISFDDDDLDLPAGVEEKRHDQRIRLGRLWMRYESRLIPISDISKSGLFATTKIAELPPSRIFKFNIVAEVNETTINIPAQGQVIRHSKFQGYAVRYDTKVDVWKKLLELDHVKV